MNIIRITDLDLPELKLYHELSEPSLQHYYEPEPGLFIAETPMIIQRAADAGYEPVSVLIEDRGEETIEDTLRQCGSCFSEERTDRALPVYTASYDVLKTITGFPLTRGVLCAMRRKMLPPAQALLENTRRIAVLDSVMNPTNLGAIFRSAAALGVDAVLLSKGCTDPLYRRAVRVSMGTVFQVPWTFLADWPAQIALLKQYGFRTCAMSLGKRSVSLREIRLAPDEKAAIVLGSEGPGLPPETVRACDLSIRIPMAHGVDSLNVAAASAVAFYQLL